MRITVYILIALISLLVPLKKADIAKLQPVEAVMVRERGGGIEIFTDTGAWGSGKTVGEALNDLMTNTPGVIYLDTAKYLLVSKEEQIEALRADLKGNVRLALCEPEDDLVDIVAYLEVHDHMPKISKWCIGDELPLYISKKCKTSEIYS